MRKLFSMIVFLVLALTSYPQWYQHENIPTADDLTCIMFSDSMHGWITGYDGIILQTTDGGDSWEMLETLTTADLSDIFFPDNLHGWAIGTLEDYTDVVISTIDGGSNWNVSYTTDYDLSDVFFTDSLNGWITGWYYALLHTTDGGLNWEVTSFPGITMPNKVQFLNAEIGFIGGTNHNSGFDLEIYKTTNGGQTWDEIKRMTSDWHLYELFFIDAMNGWFVGHYDIQGIHGQDTSGNVICYSNNGGYGWATGFDKEDQYINALVFTDPLNGWAVSNEGRLLTSLNGGASWEEQSYPPYENLTDITFSDEQNGWAAGKNGTVMHTDNNGAAGFTDSFSRPSLVKISPNPAGDRIRISLAMNQPGEAVISIYNCHGSLVKVTLRGYLSKGIHNIETTLDYMPSGLYLIELRAAGIGQRTVGKFVKR